MSLKNRRAIRNNEMSCDIFNSMAKEKADFDNLDLINTGIYTFATKLLNLNKLGLQKAKISNKQMTTSYSQSNLSIEISKQGLMTFRDSSKTTIEINDRPKCNKNEIQTFSVSKINLNFEAKKENIDCFERMKNEIEILRKENKNQFEKISNLEKKVDEKDQRIKSLEGIIENERKDYNEKLKQKFYDDGYPKNEIKVKRTTSCIKNNSNPTFWKENSNTIIKKYELNKNYKIKIKDITVGSTSEIHKYLYKKNSNEDSVTLLK